MDPDIYLEQSKKVRVRAVPIMSRADRSTDGSPWQDLNSRAIWATVIAVTFGASPAILTVIWVVTHRYNKTPLKGVGGWLLVLCLTLTMGYPLANLANLEGLFRLVLTALPATISAYEAFLAYSICVGFALLAFSVYAGISLKFLKATALQTTRRFFVVNVCVALLTLGVTFLVGLQSLMVAAMVPGAADEVVNAVAFGAGWFVYLHRSQRVKATYSEHATRAQKAIQS